MALRRTTILSRGSRDGATIPGRSTCGQRRGAVLLLAAIVATGTAFGAAAAQGGATKTPARIQVGGASLPNMNGMWVRNDTILFDPKVEDPLKLAPPYRPEWLREFDEHRRIVAATGVNDGDPTSGCMPPGMPRMMVVVYPMDLLLTPGRVTVITEFMSQVRRIYTDGRGHPDDPDITFNGHSIGHWERDTLVVDTVAMRGDTRLDQSGMKHSDQSRVIERFRLLDPDRLELQITLEDPVAFERPWTVTRTFHRAAPDDEIREYVCLENNRNPIRADGTVDVQLLRSSERSPSGSK